MSELIVFLSLFTAGLGVLGTNPVAPADAARRDFTINAIYLAPDGTLCAS